MVNSFFIIHFPILDNKYSESILSQDLDTPLSEVDKWIVQTVVRFFSIQTHSLSELRTFRDMTRTYCNENKISSLCKLFYMLFK